ncbi:MAG: tRNA lysidine(34) synthetase TilS [Thermodesulfobacteriota bacterium]
MHPLEKKIARLVVDERLIGREETVVTGVSGGPDSMALLHLLLATARQHPFALTAAHVHHGLRPGEADDDEKLVRAHCRDLDIPCDVLHVDAAGRAAAEGLSLEHAGRLLRYRHFTACAARHDAARIAVGHTADDQAEEVLLRLLRGSGRAGLAGMSLMCGRVIRPLLTTPKQELLAYLADRAIPYRIDSSNADPRHVRNRVRADLLPILEEQFNPAVRAGLRRTADILRCEEDYLRQRTAELWRKAVREQDGDDGRGPRHELLLPVLRRAHPAMARRIVEELLIRHGCPAGFERIANLLHLAFGNAGSGRVHLPGGVRAVREGDSLLCYRPPDMADLRSDPHPPPPSFLYRMKSPGQLQIRETGARLVIEPQAHPPSDRELLGSGALYLDAATVRFPIVVRPPRPGDRIRPLGAPGRKKVSDFLAARRVPHARRASVVLLESEGEIVAIAGMTIAERCRLTGNSSGVLRISLADKGLYEGDDPW